MLSAIFLSKSIEQYKGASYQRDILYELAKRLDISVYGPGSKNYSQNDKLEDVIAKVGKRPDCIITGHRWLSDDRGKPVDQYPNLDLRASRIPLYGFLNKEYVNLEEKLTFFRRNRFVRVFSHHHDAERFNQSEHRFRFVPFGFSSQRLNSPAGPKTKAIDLLFSGILINPNPMVGQTDARLQIQRHIFFELDNYPIAKRPQYRETSIVWNAQPPAEFVGRSGKSLYKLLKYIFPKYSHKYLSEERYSALLTASRIVLCTPSPMGLISPRYFEAMAAGALVLTEFGPQLNEIFSDSDYVSFSSDNGPTDFAEKFDWFIRDDTERIKIAEKACRRAWENHSWEARADRIVNEIVDSI